MRPDELPPTYRPAPASPPPLSKIHAEILSTLVRRPEWRAEDLAGELYLSEGAVRSHLNVLTELGLVEVRMERNGPGRPRHLYSVSSRGRATFPSGYQYWLAAVLAVLETRAPQVYEALPEWLLEADTAGRSELAEPVARRIAHLSELMNQMGHQVELAADEEGERMEVFNCGFFIAAKGHPWVCAAERGLMQNRLPEREITLVQRMTDGAPTCVFRLSPR